jgi:TPR repeat protein
LPDSCARSVSTPAGTPKPRSPIAPALGDLAARVYCQPDRLQSLADAGDASAIALLGTKYHRGCQLKTDAAAAEALLRRAANLGQPAYAAQLAEGYALFWGIGCERDVHKAAALFERSALAGYAPAQYFIARCYELAEGVAAADLVRAFEFCRAAADQDYVPALNCLGFYYQNGIGVPRNLGEATRLLRASADRAFPAALFNLGHCHEFGLGVPLDLIEAAQLYKRSDAQHYVDARAALERLQKMVRATAAIAIRRRGRHRRRSCGLTRAHRPPHTGAGAPRGFRGQLGASRYSVQCRVRYGRHGPGTRCSRVR